MLCCNLADIPRVSVRGPQMQHNRANVKALRLHMLNSISRLSALYRSFIHHHQSRRRAGDLQQVRELWERLKREQVWLHRRQNQISAPRRLGRVRAGVGWRVDHNEVDALNAGLLDGCAEPSRMR